MISGVAKVDGETGVKISNYINMLLDEKKVQMVYKIETPPVIYYDFILALDSSGSFGGSKAQYDSIISDIPKFLEKIPKNYPDATFNVSIISWDDDIDFAYDKQNKFNNSDPLKVKLAPINDIINESKKLNDHYICSQSEQTDLSVPIKASLDILNAPGNILNDKDSYGRKQFMMIVTGDGEFKPATSDLLNAATNKIYVVGLDIENKSELENYLKNIVTKGTNPRISSSSDYFSYDRSIFETTLNMSLEEALLAHFKRIMDKTVAYDIEISDQLYCYYEPEPNSLRIDDTRSNNINSHRLLDRTTEIKIEVPALPPNRTTTVSFYAKNTFNPMAVPVTVSQINGPLTICSPTKVSSGILSYTWFNDKTMQMTLDYPDTRVTIQPTH